MSMSATADDEEGLWGFEYGNDGGYVFRSGQWVYKHTDEIVLEGMCMSPAGWKTCNKADCIQLLHPKAKMCRECLKWFCGETCFWVHKGKDECKRDETSFRVH